MTIWNGITEQGAVVPIQVDAQGRVVVSGGGGVPAEVYGTAKASATASNTGVLTYSQNLTCVRQSAGIYNLSFVTPLPNANYAVVGTCAEYPGYIITASAQTANGFTVSAWNLAASNADAAFSVAVFNGEPSEVTPLILPTSTVAEVKALRAEVDKLKKDKTS